MAGVTAIFVKIFVLMLVSLCVNSEMTAESVYEFLSHSIFKIIHKLDNVESRMANMEKKLQEFQTLDRFHRNGISGKETKDVEKTSVTTQPLLLFKAISDEKKILRKTMNDFRTRFDDFVGTLNQTIATFRDSLQKDISAMNISYETKVEELSTTLHVRAEDLIHEVKELKKYVHSEIAHIGTWGVWESWSQCSVTCGSGIARRKRACLYSAGNTTHLYCPGDSNEYQHCSTQHCQEINGRWSRWSSWSSCSKETCTQTRSRTCTDPAPSTHGQMCQGNSMDTTNCNLHICVLKLRVRLVGGQTSNSGRLEVSSDGWNWGTVCDDHFDISDAQVACKMLGRSGPAVVLEAASVNDGIGPIYMDDLHCSGEEDNLLNCTHNDWGMHNCEHTEDVGVLCEE